MAFEQTSALDIFTDWQLLLMVVQGSVPRSVFDLPSLGVLQESLPAMTASYHARTLVTIKLTIKHCRSYIRHEQFSISSTQANAVELRSTIRERTMAMLSFDWSATRDASFGLLGLISSEASRFSNRTEHGWRRPLK